MLGTPLGSTYLKHAPAATLSSLKLQAGQCLTCTL